MVKDSKVIVPIFIAKKPKDHYESYIENSTQDILVAIGSGEAKQSSNISESNTMPSAWDMSSYPMDARYSF